MPITRIRLRQFKCFRDSRDIPLAPLTLIFGRNNTGKSSIVQSLLLLRQTLDSAGYGQRLDLRGDLYPAGSYLDIVHQHRLKEDVSMEFDVTFVGENEPATIFLEFSSEEPQQPRLVQLRVVHPSVDPLEIRRSRGRGGPYELFLGGKSHGLEKRANILFTFKRFFPLIGEEPPRRGRPTEKHDASRRVAARALMALEESLRTMRAVGAFRRHPLRRYEYQGRALEAIDATGESVVDALIDDMVRRGRKRGELFHAVNRWLRTVGHVRLLPLKRISKSARIFELRMKDTDSGRWANFADVGFGIGQAFPVFVEGLRTPAGATFIVQEPEIHLHPDAQLGMADFLMALARSGRRVIAETHSDNLLLRIRRSLIPVNGRRALLSPSDVSVIYVKKDRDGASQAIPLEVDQLGQIRNWPEGFMEEATEERMAILEGMAETRAEEG